MHLIAIGGSDAGISAALRARELDPSTDVTVVVADEYPNFSICGIPYYVSGEVTHWRNLAHRTYADLEATGMQLGSTPPPPTSTSTATQLLGHRPRRRGAMLAYDALVVGTGAVPVRPPIGGLDQLGPEQGVHLLHSMGDTFALTAPSSAPALKRAVIVGAGYIGLEMAEGLTTRGLSGHPDRAAPRSPADRRPRARRARPRPNSNATASKCLRHARRRDRADHQRLTARR